MDAMNAFYSVFEHHGETKTKIEAQQKLFRIKNQIVSECVL